MSKKIYSHGKLLVNQDLASHKLIENWIRNKKFLKYEVSQLLLDRVGGGKRNRLYCFRNEYVQCEVVMKVSHISQSYKFWRKADLIIASYLKDYNYRGYTSSVKLQKVGIDTIEPIAYWTYKPSLLHRKSYFLYKKVKSELTAAQLFDKIIMSDIDDKDLLVKAIVNRCIGIVKNIHTANMRHDDPHGNNILTDIRCGDVAALNERKILSARFTLIDNDRCTTARTVAPSIKKFFDLKCLVRLKICNIPQQDLLRQYLGESYTKYWWYVLNFWKLGGFRIHKQISNLLK